MAYEEQAPFGNGQGQGRWVPLRLPRGASSWRVLPHSRLSGSFALPKPRHGAARRYRLSSSAARRSCMGMLAQSGENGHGGCGVAQWGEAERTADLSNCGIPLHQRVVTGDDLHSDCGLRGRQPGHTGASTVPASTCCTRAALRKAKTAGVASSGFRWLLAAGANRAWPEASGVVPRDSPPVPADLRPHVTPAAAARSSRRGTPMCVPSSPAAQAYRLCRQPLGAAPTHTRAATCLPRTCAGKMRVLAGEGGHAQQRIPQPHRYAPRLPSAKAMLRKVAVRAAAWRKFGASSARAVPGHRLETQRRNPQHCAATWRRTEPETGTRSVPSAMPKRSWRTS